MSFEAIYTRDFRGQPLQVQLWDTEQPTPEAKFAMQIVERFGLIAGKKAGEDSAGRSVTDALSVEDTVARAFDLAAETYRVMRERNLAFEMLPYEEARDKARAESERN